MRLRNNTILPNLKRKAMTPVIYERIDSNNVRIGTKWLKFTKKWTYGGPEIAHHFDNISGVTIFEDGAKRFISNSWYDINTSGTYEEFERSFELWIKSLDEEIERL